MIRAIANKTFAKMVAFRSAGHIYACGSSQFHMVTVLLEYFDVICSVVYILYSSSSFPTFSNPGYFMLEGSSTLSSSSSLARMIIMIMTTGGNGYKSVLEY